MNPIQAIIEELDHLNLWEKEVEITRGQFLKTKGSIDTNIYFVTSGSLRIFLEDDHEEHTIRFGYTNNLIAALDSYITQKPSDLYIQALKKTTAKKISKPTFMNFIWESENRSKAWLEILGMLIFQQMEREHDLLTSSPVERYQRVLKRSPQLFQEIPHKYIASYLRMTPETLSRIKKS